MIKKIFLLSFTLLLFTNCGYNPIFLKKNQNFDLNKINVSGEKRINNLLLRNLNFINNPSQKIFEITLTSSTNRLY